MGTLLVVTLLATLAFALAGVSIRHLSLLARTTSPASGAGTEPAPGTEPVGTAAVELIDPSEFLSIEDRIRLLHWSEY